MKALIIGMGEVGAALAVVLMDKDLEVYDLNSGVEPDLGATFDILHICFPYSDGVKGFTNYVKAYQYRYEPKYTIIHSTVPVGTSRKCGALHSPIRGMHPELESGIRTFAKFIGGAGASGVADYFRKKGLRVVLVDNQETTEAGKLFDTEYYRSCIVFAQKVKIYCQENGLNFHEVYTLFNQTYNEGYSLLGHPEFVRPVLQPIMKLEGEKKIGGHCVLENSVLLSMSEKNQMDAK